MNPHASQASRSRFSSGSVASASRAPHREQYGSMAAIHGGVPSPEATSVDRPSGPRSAAARKASSSSVSRRSTLGPDDQDRGHHDQREEHEADHDPRKPEQALDV